MYKVIATGDNLSLTGEFIVEDMTTFAQWNRGSKGEIEMVHEKGAKLGSLAASIVKASAKDLVALVLKCEDEEDGTDEVVEFKPNMKSAAKLKKSIEEACIDHAIRTGNYLAHPMTSMTKAEYEAQLMEGHAGD